MALRMSMLLGLAQIKWYTGTPLELFILILKSFRLQTRLPLRLVKGMLWFSPGIPLIGVFAFVMGGISSGERRIKIVRYSLQKHFYQAIFFPKSTWTPRGYLLTELDAKQKIETKLEPSITLRLAFSIHHSFARCEKCEYEVNVRRARVSHFLTSSKLQNAQHHEDVPYFS